MRIRGIEWATAKIAGQSDTIDDMARRLARKEQGGQRGARHCMNDVIMAFEPGDECRTDEAAGTEDGK